MILKPHLDFLTPEEREELNKLSQLREIYYQKIIGVVDDDLHHKKDIQSLLSERDELVRKQMSVYALMENHFLNAENRYIEDRKGNKKAILNDVKTILDNLVIDDFLYMIAAMTHEAANTEIDSEAPFFDFMLHLLEAQIKAYDADKDIDDFFGTETITDDYTLPPIPTMIQEAAKKFYQLYKKSYINGTSTRGKKEYRTKSRIVAEDLIDIADITKLSLITNQYYHNALSLTENKTAYLQMLKGAENLTFKDGNLYFRGSSLTPLTMAEIKDIQTKEGIENIDLPFLQAIYSYLLQISKQNNYQPVKNVRIYMPDLLRYLGRRTDDNTLQAVLNQIYSFQTLGGFMFENGRISTYQVLVFHEHRSTDNTIEIESPYLNNIIKKVRQTSRRLKKDGTPLLNKSGTTQLIPSHSYLIHSDINKERNKAAIINVFVIVRLIETAGAKKNKKGELQGNPHITAANLIKQNAQLYERLKVSQKPNQLLKRVFSKTWELLRQYTDLEAAYNDIQLPDTKNPMYIPTMKNLNTLVFEFPHKGKSKAATEKKEG